MPTNLDVQNLKAFRGDDYGVELVLADSNDVAIDITGWLFFFTIKNQRSDPDDKAVIRKNVSATLNPTAGRITIALTAAETNNLQGAYFYDIQYKDDNNIIQTVTSGSITFETDITRRTT